MNNYIDLYTDGAARANGTNKSRGGYGWCIVDDNIIINKGYGGEKNTTNNRMELTAVLNGLKEAIKYRDNYAYFSKPIIKIYSDSAYFINCFQEKWYVNWQKNGWLNSQKQPVVNRDLWEQIIPFFSMNFIEFYKVKGHAGNKYNEFVDELACKGADELK
jgi:ribonuclease HI